MIKENVLEFSAWLLWKRANPNSYEKIFQKFCDSRKWKTEFQRVVKGVGVIDFYIHDFNVMVEIDGIRHCEPQQILLDRIRDKKLKEKGYWVIRIPNKFVGNWAYMQIAFKRIKVALV